MAGGKATTFENSLLQLIFNGVGISNIADNTATSPITNLYISLHTADPGAGGNQSTSEATYTGYTRVAVARTTSGWVVTGNSVSPAATISFPQATGGSETETYFAVGTASSGAGEILYRGPLSPSVSISAGVTPQMSTSTAITEN
jgi:hypothetical protein